MTVAYTPTTWNSGAQPGIDADKLNNIEGGIVDLRDEVNSFPSGLTASAGVHVTGAGGIGSTGEGIELTYAAGWGFVLSYDRVADAYTNLNIDGSRVEFYSEGSERIKLLPGGTHIKTHSGAEPLFITREGSVIESVKIWVDDRNVLFESIQNETGADYGGFQFRLDTDSSYSTFAVKAGSRGLIQAFSMGRVAVDAQAYSVLNTLAFSATVQPDLDDSNVHDLTLTGDCTLANPLNSKSGGQYTFIIRQDGTGSRSITSFGSAYKFPGGLTPSLSTAANAVDIISAVSDGTYLYCTFIKDVK